MKDSEFEAIIGVLILVNLVLALLFIFSLVYVSDVSYQHGFNYGYSQYESIYWNSSRRNLEDAYIDVFDDESENFLRMRDLFTPMPDEMVTVVGDGFHDGGFCFWVNHSCVLNSYFFDDQCSYLVMIPSFGLIEVVDVAGGDLDV